MASRVKSFPRPYRLAALVMLGCTVPAFAQNTVPQASPTPEPTINALPSASPTPSPVAPPRATPTPSATTVPRPAPRATATPAVVAPAPTITPRPRAIAPVATPMPEPAPTLPAEPVAPIQPSPTPSATAAPAPAASVGIAPWMWLAALVVLVGLALLGLSKWRSRAERAMEDVGEGDERVVFEPEAAAEAVAVPAPVPEPAAPVATAARATLELELVPKRAGSNLLSAAVEYLIVIRNTGAAPATGVRLDVRLLGTGRQQDALIDALFSTPIAQPITAPFDLPPGSTVELGGMAMHPKSTLEVLEANGKTFFIPILTIHVRYDWDGGSGQTARAFVIGIDRGADAKLAPFRLDAGARMLDTVRALDYTATGES
jgi:hypothetical protein